jgi:hypothetical protein
LHSTKKYFRFHDHLIVNTNLVRSFYWLEVFKTIRLILVDKLINKS